MRSSLVVFEQLSPNHSGKRKKPVDRITPHCVVGQASVESLGKTFASRLRMASSNYGIGADGRVGMYVDEENRSWCSSSSANDQRAITIECASDATTPYTFKPEVYQTLIKLCADICKRYNKTKLVWIPDKTEALKYVPKANEMQLTVHRWFANKSCPGEWMMSHMSDLAYQVTKLLQPVVSSDGYKVRITANALNVRSGPSVQNSIKSVVKKGEVYTIVEEYNGWGRLKSGAGWLSLSYTEKL